MITIIIMKIMKYINTIMIMKMCNNNVIIIIIIIMKYNNNETND